MRNPDPGEQEGPVEELEARAIAWMFGGQLPQGPIELELVAGASAQIRLVTAENRELWSGRPGPPLRTDLLSHVAVGCDLRRVGSPDVAHQYGLIAEPQLPDAYRLLDLADLNFRADQCIDLIKLVALQGSGMAFGETRIRFRQGHYHRKEDVISLNEFRAATIGAQWGLSSSQADFLPVQWQRLVSGPNAVALRFPLRRWGIAAQRRWNEDRLIDLWIALEGVFKRDDDRSYIPEVIAPRVVRLLEWDPDMSGRLRDSYNLRILIAHGRWDYEEEALSRAIGTAEDVLRRSLTVLLSATAEVDPRV